METTEQTKKSKKTNTSITYPKVRDNHGVNNVSEAYYFTLYNTDVSVANALRRTILSDIEIFVCDPYIKNNIIIHKNTTKLNNEIIKQRLGCIPIHITDLNSDTSDMICEINKTNETNGLDYITTKDIRIKLKSTDKYISENETKKIFPPNEMTKGYILINRLKPKVSNDLPGETLQLEFKISKGTAGENGMFNCVSQCGYGNTPDKSRQEEAWQKIEEGIKNKYKTVDEETTISKKEIMDKINYEKENWFNHTAQKIYIKNSYDFAIESVGVFTNITILIMACDTIIEKLNDIAQNINNPKKVELLYNKTTIENSVDIHLHKEDYTISKIIEYVLYEEYYKNKTLNYIGCRKHHPHDNHMVLRMGFRHEKDYNEENIKLLIKNSCLVNINLFKKIKSYFE